MRIALRLLALLPLAGCATASAEPEPPVPASTPTAISTPAASSAEDPGLQAVATRRHIPLSEALAAHDGELVFLVDKSDRTLTVRKGDAVVRTYRVGLAPGIEATNDKVRQGDLATPEGDFTIVTRNDRSRFHLFLGIDYPNSEDAERGLRDGLITEAEARLIREADAAGRVPPYNTTLGGAIGLHGGGGWGDWTLGCIAVENDEIEEIWAVAPLGTRVRIQD